MKCSKCPKRKTCKVVCKEMEKYLRGMGIYSADWIRPEVSSARRGEGKYKGHWKEIPISALEEGEKAKI